MQKNTAKTLTWLGFVVVFIGLALPWVSVPRHTQRVNIQEPGVSGYSESTVGGFSMSGFRTSASAVGLTLPGFCVVIAALVCAILVATSSARWVCWLLCIYGLLHVGFMTAALSSTPNMDPAFGLAVVVVGFVLQIASLFGKAT
jgi:hypothetical protein